MLTITVNQLNRYVKSLLEQDSNLQDIYIRGEISNFKAHYKSGHMYFSLKDDESVVKAVMFRGYASQLKFMPEEGMAVIARASVGLYEVNGEYQVYVTDLQPDGIGAMEIAIRQLREKLDKKGYFLPEHKKELPRYPKTIGVITSKTGAAFGDIKKVLSARYPIAEIKFFAASVQGELAVPSLIEGIKTLDNNCDVMIVGRGGGSKEDLWAFNDENLANAVFFANTPIVSAVGHEMDVSICDLVADVQAATPSAAAEIVAPSIDEVRMALEKYEAFIKKDAISKMELYSKKLETISKMPILSDPSIYLREKQKKLDLLYDSMYNIQKQYFSNLGKEITNKAKVLDSLSPFAVLARGYSAAFKDSKAIKSVTQLAEDDKFSLKMRDGIIEATVDAIELKG